MRTQFKRWKKKRNFKKSWLQGGLGLTNTKCSDITAHTFNLPFSPYSTVKEQATDQPLTLFYSTLKTRVTQKREPALPNDQMNGKLMRRIPKVITSLTWTIPSVFLTIIIHLSDVIMTPGPNAFTHQWDLTKKKKKKIYTGCNNEKAGRSFISRWASDGNVLPFSFAQSSCLTNMNQVNIFLIVRLWGRILAAFFKVNHLRSLIRSRGNLQNCLSEVQGLKAPYPFSDLYFYNPSGGRNNFRGLWI